MICGEPSPSEVVGLDDLPATFEQLRGPNAETKVQVSLRSAWQRHRALRPLEIGRAPL
jgi:hypothetical protein